MSSTGRVSRRNRINRGRNNQEVKLEMANQIGKRYVCKKCGSEFIVTKAGDGALVCCGQPMELKK